MATSAGSKSPALWGTESHIVELFGPWAAQIRCERRHFKFRYRGTTHWVQIFRDYYGPTHKALLRNQLLQCATMLKLPIKKEKHESDERSSGESPEVLWGTQS